MNLDRLIRDKEIDFLDFGCSKGGSVGWAKRTLAGRRGIGVDIDPRKVEAAANSGLEVVHGDVMKLDCSDGAVSFVTMLHFLEHLPDAYTARRCIASACRLARDFVFMRHPWFGSDAELFSLGYKFYWSDWHGHPNHFDVLDFYKAIREVRPRPHQWYMFGRNRVFDIRDSAIVPISDPIDRHALSPKEFADRPEVPLAGPAFREVACLIVIGPQSRDPLPQLLKDHVMISSSKDVRQFTE